MVTRALTLRWLNYTSGLRSGTSQRLRLVLGSTVLVTLFAVAAVVPQLRLFTTVERSYLLDAFLVSALPLLGLLLAVFTAERRLGPRQYAQYPVTGVARGLWLSALLSPWALLLWGYALLRLLLRVLLLGYPPLPEVIAAAVLVLLTTALTQLGIVVSQLFLATGLVASLRRWIGLLLFSALAPLTLFVIAEITNGDATAARQTAQLVAWSPLGYAFSGGDFWLAANWAGVAVSLGSAIVLLLVLYLSYCGFTKLLLQSVAKPRPNGSVGLGVFDFFPDTPAGVIAARTVIYWRRDPRYFIGLLALPVAAAAVVFALAVAGMRFEYLVLLPVPVILYLLGWSIHNDISMDSTAIWMHVASNTRGRDDRVGRLTPIVLLGVPLLVIGTTVSVLLMGQWHTFTTVFGLNTAMLLIGAGISTVASAWVVYPATRPGESPFSQPQYQGAGATVAQTVSFLGGLLLAMPTIVLAVITLTTAPNLTLAIATVLLGVGSGVLVLLACIRLGGLIFDRTAPEIVRTTEVYD